MKKEHLFDLCKASVLGLFELRGFGKDQHKKEKPLNAFHGSADSFAVERDGKYITFRATFNFICVEIKRVQGTVVYSYTSYDDECTASLSGNTIWGWESKFFHTFKEWQDALDASIQAKEDLVLLEHVRKRHIQILADEQKKVDAITAQIFNLKKDVDALSKRVSIGTQSPAPGSIGKNKKPRATSNPYQSKPKGGGSAKPKSGTRKKSQT